MMASEYQNEMRFHQCAHCYVVIVFENTLNTMMSSNAIYSVPTIQNTLFPTQLKSGVQHVSLIRPTRMPKLSVDPGAISNHKMLKRAFSNQRVYICEQSRDYQMRNLEKDVLEKESPTEVLELLESISLRDLMSISREIRDRGHPDFITFSPKVFIPVTRYEASTVLYRQKCALCVTLGQIRENVSRVEYYKALYIYLFRTILNLIDEHGLGADFVEICANIVPLLSNLSRIDELT